MSDHKHRCIRCGLEFDCFNPRECIAEYNVLPNYRTRDEHGQLVVRQHCVIVGQDAKGPVYRPAEAVKS